MKGNGSFLFLIFLFLLIGGCVTIPPPSPPQIEGWHKQYFISPHFDPSRIQKGGLAILPVSGKGAPEGVRLNASFEILQAFDLTFRGARILSRPVLLDILKEEEKLSDMKELIRAYEEDRSLARGLLRDIGSTLGVRYLFYSRITSVDKITIPFLPGASQREETLAGGQVTVSQSGPGLFNDEAQKFVSIAGEVWDTRCQEVVWVGEGGARVKERVEVEQFRVEETFIQAAHSLVSAVALPEGKGGKDECLAPSR